MRVHTTGMPNTAYHPSNGTDSGYPHGWIRPRRILLATDLTDLPQTLPAAVDEAKRYAASLLIVHVLPDYTSPPAAPSLLIYSHHEEHRQHAALQLKAALLMVEAQGIECSSRILIGDVVEQLEAIATEWQPDRVIAGSHGKEKYCLRILGSVAEKLFRTLAVPVIAVGPKAVRRSFLKPRNRRVLVPISFKNDSAGVVRFASAYAHGHDVDTILLHVIPGVYGQSSSALRANRCRAEMMKRFAASNADKPAPICIVKNGETSEMVLQYASECSIDLIVLGSVTASDFRPELVPKTAYGVLSSAPCPVLILRQIPDKPDASKHSAQQLASDRFTDPLEDEPEHAAVTIAR